MVSDRDVSPAPWRRALVEAGLVFVAVLLLSRWQLGLWNGFIDFDGHFHLRVAQWIAHFGLWTDLPWLPYTVLGERGPDHQWLWHLSLVPFTWLSDPDSALAWATAGNAALVPAVLAFALRMLGVPAAPVFALLAACAGAYMPARLLMLRSQNTAIVFMVLSIWALARGRYRTLLLLAFLFMESYHGAVILLPIAVLGCALHSALQRRPVIAPLVAVGAGEALALVINPWFPRKIEYLLFHLFFMMEHPMYGENLSALVGREWYPPLWRNLLLDSWPAHLLLAAAIAAIALRARGERGWRPATETLLAIGVAFLSLGLYWKASRFMEYYIPFCAVAAGLAARDTWPSDFLTRGRAVALVVVAAVLASVGLAPMSTFTLVPRDHLAQVGERLNQLARPGEIVFNSSWEDFTALVWWADSYRYINGLDGHLLAYRDPARLAVWLSLGAGAVKDPVEVIVRGFQAHFVVVPPQHEALARQLKESPRVVEQAATRDGWLFEIRQ